MTISSETYKVIYTGDGSTVAFPYTFRILAEGDIQVILYTIADGTETVQTLTTDYAVSGVDDASGGTVTMVAATSSSYQLILKRDMSLTQETDYVENDPFPAASHERALDRLTMLAQQNKEEDNRAFQLDSSVDVPATIQPPTAAGYLYYDGAAYLFNALTSTDYAGDISTGVDASKSTSPVAGDIYVATDTSKFYLCFTTGTWTDYNQDVVDRNTLEIMNIAQDSAGSSPVYERNVPYQHSLAQSITPARDMYCSAVSFKFGTVDGSASAAFRVETDDSGEPSGTLADGFLEVAWSPTTSDDWEELALGFIGKLAAGTKYWLVMTNDASIGVDFALMRSTSSVMAGENYAWNNSAVWYVYAEEFGDLAVRIGTTTFAAGDAVKVVANTFALAQADSLANSDTFIGIVSAVSSASFYSFTDIVTDGKITAFTGLTEGARYYLDPDTAGDITATKTSTSTEVIKPVMIALTETTGLIVNQLGVIVP